MPMTYTCERCHRASELFHCRSVDEYLCDACIEQVADEETLARYKALIAAENGTLGAGRGKAAR